MIVVTTRMKGTARPLPVLKTNIPVPAVAVFLASGFVMATTIVEMKAMSRPVFVTILRVTLSRAFSVTCHAIAFPSFGRAMEMMTAMMGQTKIRSFA